jgi:hypothetical protein
MKCDSLSKEDLISEVIIPNLPSAWMKDLKNSQIGLGDENQEDFGRIVSYRRAD